MLSKEAEVMLVTIALQESRIKYRQQLGGPARSFWQFEHGGGCVGVCSHPSSSSYMKEVMQALGYSFDSHVLYDKMMDNDILAACAARLLLWTDPKSLPAVGQVDAAWDTYKRIWRPGKPHPETWGELYKQAVEVL